MTAFPSLAVWREPFLALAAGGAILIVLAAAVARCARTAAGRRAVWQAAVLSLAVLFLGELTGLAGGLTD